MSPRDDGRYAPNTEQLEHPAQWIQWEDPHGGDAGARFFFTKLKWISDGPTFKVLPIRAWISGQVNIPKAGVYRAAARTKWDRQERLGHHPTTNSGLTDDTWFY